VSTTFVSWDEVFYLTFVLSRVLDAMLIVQNFMAMLFYTYQKAF
jgi:hypothetical protein